MSETAGRMYEIYLTDSNVPGAHPARVAEIIAISDAAEAHDLCITLQSYLRDGIEAHFVASEEGTGNDLAPA